MYTLASRLSGLGIISLQTGETVGVVQAPVLDPDHLHVVAYTCATGRSNQSMVLMAQDIRQMALDCLIVDSEEELTEPGDIVRLRPYLDNPFRLNGKPVITDLGRKMGKVEDFTIHLEHQMVQKLYIQPPLFRALFGSSLVVDRAQIIDVTPQQIVVRDTTEKAPLLTGEPTPETHS
jgi:sporulation protein YlmC with PRC-barrel domain